MKKFFAAIVTLLLMFSLTACFSSEVEYYNDYYEDYHEYYETERETTTDDAKTTETTTMESSSEIIEKIGTEEYCTEINAQNTITTTRNYTEPSSVRNPVTIISQQTSRPVTVTPQPTRRPVTTTILQTTKPFSTTTTTKPVTVTNPPATTQPVKKAPAYSPESELISLLNTINDYRIENGLSKLKLDSELCKFAYIRAQEQDIEKGHTRPDHTAYYTILDEYDYNYSGCGENVAYGKNVTVISTFDRWKASASHNLNMLESRWAKAGIAMYKHTDGSYNIDLLFTC